MRTSLLPGLTSAATRAQRHGATEVRLFEIARTFSPSGDVLPVETTTLALTLAGQRPGWIGAESPFDLYDGKGVVEAILDAVLGRAPDLTRGDVPPFMHPKRSAVLAPTTQPALSARKRVALAGNKKASVLLTLEINKSRLSAGYYHKSEPGRRLAALIAERLAAAGTFGETQCEAVTSAEYLIINTAMPALWLTLPREATGSATTVARSLFEALAGLLKNDR